MDGYDRDRDGGRDGPGRDDGSRRPRLQLKARSADADKTAAAIAGGGSSLFGGARPRELALQEAGRDYRKEDLVRSAGAVKRRETNDEKRMKKEITELKENLEALPKGGEEYDVIHGELSEKETALAKLTLELDDKVRFAQRNAPEGGDRGGAKRGDEKGGEGAGAAGDGAADGAPGEKKDSRSRDRDLDRGWGEGKAERQRGGGGKSGGGDKKPGGSGGGRESTQREPRAPRAMMKAAEPEAVKVVSGGFAALGVDDDA
jgi:TAG lipase/steryl ester hydrolase/phospholipase A2/LPA acyltransferase